MTSERGLPARGRILTSPSDSRTVPVNLSPRGLRKTTQDRESKVTRPLTLGTENTTLRGVSRA
jgi:hypothetical protein